MNTNVLSLQQQYDTSAKAVINSPFEFIFNAKTFTDLDDDPAQITYTIKFKDEASATWLRFVPEDRKFMGIPESFNEVEITVTASDGFSEASDKFKLTVNASVNYYAELISTIVGPLVSVLAFIKYRVVIYNYLCKKKYKYLRVN